MAKTTLQLLVLGTMFIFCWSMVRLVRYIKTKRVNPELWCTVFEGLTQGAVRLDDLKAPEEVIEKKVRRDGKDKDPYDFDEIESRISEQITGEKSA
jgi:hypothetical protein